MKGRNKRHGRALVTTARRTAALNTLPVEGRGNIREELAAAAVALFRRAKEPAAAEVVSEKEARELFQAELEAVRARLEEALAENARLQRRIAGRQKLDEATIHCGAPVIETVSRVPMVSLVGHSQKLPIGTVKKPFTARLWAWMRGRE
jgi:hypothetical protein